MANEKISADSAGERRPRGTGDGGNHAQDLVVDTANG